jgi:hypothetical protein
MAPHMPDNMCNPYSFWACISALTPCLSLTVPCLHCPGTDAAQSEVHPQQSQAGNLPRVGRMRMALRIILNALLLVQLLLAAWYIFMTAAWVAVSALLGRPAALPVLSLAGECGQRVSAVYGVGHNAQSSCRVCKCMCVLPVLWGAACLLPLTALHGAVSFCFQASVFITCVDACHALLACTCVQLVDSLSLPSPSNASSLRWLLSHPRSRACSQTMQQLGREH